MEISNLLTANKNNTYHITIHRTKALNALNAIVLKELEFVLASVKDDNTVSGVIITGSGEKAFVAGADIGELAGLDSSAGKKVSEDGQKIFETIENFPKPIIAAVNGFALGGGCELAMACHMRVASDNAKFGLPEVSLGLIPGYGGTQRLTQLVGKGRAIELMTTGEMITAQRAYEIGLANHVVPTGDLITTCEKILSKIGTRAPLAVARTIKLANSAYSGTGFEQEATEFGNSFDTQDAKEGTSAFLEKRKPNFEGK